MNLAKEIEKYFDLLWPLNRSLTGDDNRKSLEILSEISNINLLEIPSGEKCFDWVVPDEYIVRDAYIETLDGSRIVDFQTHNLHLMGYSSPIDKVMSWDELENFIYFIEDIPDAIPYKTSYYVKSWGFCISYNQYLQIDKSIKYHVVIDSEFNSKGSMTIGERIIKGRRKEEILFSTYICHPSMANNELSGPLLTIFIQKLIEQQKDLEYTYRFLYLPETVGSICYLSKWGEYFKENLLAGFVVTCVGDAGKPTLKLSRRGDTIADRVVLNILNSNCVDFNLLDYFPTGSDERQYCSPYFNLPVVSLMRTMYSKYPEYHTSLDNKSIMSFSGMEELINYYYQIVIALENNKTYQSLNMKCEPFLQNKGLYNSTGGPKSVPLNTSAALWLLNQADGTNDLITISNKSSIPISILHNVACALKDSKLISEI